MDLYDVTGKCWVYKNDNLSELIAFISDSKEISEQLPFQVTTEVVSVKSSHALWETDYTFQYSMGGKHLINTSDIKPRRYKSMSREDLKAFLFYILVLCLSSL